MSAGDFPERVELVPPGELLVESLGWQPAAWGQALVVAGVWIVAQKDGKTALPVAVAALLAAGGAWLLFHEVRRRERRTALLVRRQEVGIYRAGRLDMTVPRDRVVLFVPEPLNTVKCFFGLAPLSALGLLPFFPLFGPEPHGPVVWLDAAAGLSVAAGALASLASLVWTRHVRLAFRLPTRGRILEDVRLTRPQAKVLFG